MSARRQLIYNEELPNGTVLQNLNETEIEMDLCSKYYTNKDIVEDNYKLPLELFYCTKPDATYIEGFWGAEIYANLRIEVTKCKNSTKNNFHCKSPEKISSTIQNGMLSYLFTTYDVDPKNYENPLKRQLYDEYNLLNANSSLEYSIQLAPKKFKSDNGLMFPDIKTFEGLDYSMKIFNRNTRSEYIFTITFEGNPSGAIYIRSYVKLQTVLTQIGGFIKTITMIGSIISMIFSKNFFFVLYFNQICHYNKISNDSAFDQQSSPNIRSEPVKIAKFKLHSIKEEKEEQIYSGLANSNLTLTNQNVIGNLEKINSYSQFNNKHFKKFSKKNSNITVISH
jgi:hypothetical protein